jgi:hypothetical protein
MISPIVQRCPRSYLVHLLREADRVAFSRRQANHGLDRLASLRLAESLPPSPFSPLATCQDLVHIAPLACTTPSLAWSRLVQADLGRAHPTIAVFPIERCTFARSWCSDSISCSTIRLCSLSGNSTAVFGVRSITALGASRIRQSTWPADLCSCWTAQISSQAWYVSVPVDATPGDVPGLPVIIVSLVEEPGRALEWINKDARMAGLA